MERGHICIELTDSTSWTTNSIFNRIRELRSAKFYETYDDDLLENGEPWRFDLKVGHRSPWVPCE